MVASFNDPDFASGRRYFDEDQVDLLDILDTWTGAGVRILITDVGVNHQHRDLIDRYDFSADLDALDGDNDAFQPIEGDSHGTGVAITIAATANNGYRTVGVAPEATISAVRMNLPGRRTIAQEEAAFAHALATGFDVINGSWSLSGAPYGDSFRYSTYAGVSAAIEALATEGRDGLGTVMVRSTGSGGFRGEDNNTHNHQNNRFSITAGASDLDSPDGQWDVLGLSPRGANILLVAPGTHSSFSAPVVTGVVALMLEANPGLGYRDVSEILALTAQHDSRETVWTENAATGWNGGAMRFDHRAGFGLVDAHAAVRLAQTWERVSTEANLLSVENVTGASRTIPTQGTVSSTFTVTRDMRVERVELGIRLAHERIGDLELELVSPDGTRSFLLSRLGQGNYDTRSDVSFDYGSVHFLGESALGTWTLNIHDRASEIGGQANNLRLSLWGAEPEEDTMYVYTEEYADLATDPDRAVLVDRAGLDHVNLAAIKSNSVLDLTPGAVSSVAGEALRIGRATVIERATAGDGNDRLTGNAVANTLNGLGGNDVLDGRGGNDVLIGGPGNDTLIGGAGRDRLEGRAGQDTASYAAITTGVTVNLSRTSEQAIVANGNDTLVSIEHVVGGTANDRLFGNALGNSLQGRAGNDLLEGRDGNDVLLGGAGNDTLRPGIGNDVVDGGAGIDTATWYEQTTGVTIDLARTDGQATSAGIETVRGIENLQGSSTVADQLFGNGVANVLTGWGGNDRLEGRGGNDVLIGRRGADQLGGGAGADRFTYLALDDAPINLSTLERIRDFAAGDIIDLSGIDANATLAGDQAFTYRGQAAFLVGVVGQVRTSGGVVQAEITGDGVVDFAIALTGLTSLAGSSFDL